MTLHFKVTDKSPISHQATPFYKKWLNCFFSCFFLDTIMEMLQSLRSKLKANGDSSHCGGQFEWVDGQLVEALKSGYWLLIDNVNFCR